MTDNYTGAVDSDAAERLIANTASRVGVYRKGDQVDSLDVDGAVDRFRMLDGPEQYDVDATVLHVLDAAGETVTETGACEIAYRLTVPTADDTYMFLGERPFEDEDAVQQYLNEHGFEEDPINIDALVDG